MRHPRLPGLLSGLLLAALCLALTLVPFLNGYLISHDLLYHLPWNDLFRQQLFSGDLYPRWLFEMNGGRGSPAFYFYSPIPFYVAALFAAIIPGAQAAWLALGATYALALLISTLGVYAFLRTLTDRTNSLVIAALYATYPYHLVVDLYTRFAFSEFFAIAWVPLIFWVIRRARNGSRLHLIGFVSLYALLIITHLPTALIFTPVILGYLYLERRQNVIARLLPFCILAVAAATAFYLVPIYLYRDQVLAKLLTAQHMDFRNAFLISGEQLSPRFAGYLVFLKVLSLISLAILLLGACIRGGDHARQRNFFLVTALIAVFMMYPASVAIWENLPLLQIVQFPWRFNIALSFLLFFFLAAACGPQPSKAAGLPQRLALALGMALSVATIAAAGYFSIRDIPPAQQAMIERTLTTHPEGGLGLLPRDLDRETLAAIADRSLAPAPALATTSAPAAIHAERSGEVISIRIDTSLSQELTIHQFSFPTWVATDVQTGKPVALRKTGSGLLAIDLEPGRHELRLVQQRSRAELLADTVSGLTWLTLFIGLLWLAVPTRGKAWTARPDALDVH